MRATPLKIMTTARRSVHTLIGSKEAFRTNTRAFMIEADITRGRRKVSKLWRRNRCLLLNHKASICRDRGRPARTEREARKNQLVRFFIELRSFGAVRTGIPRSQQ